jgi:hypothetical protein
MGETLSSSGHDWLQAVPTCSMLQRYAQHEQLSDVRMVDEYRDDSDVLQCETRLENGKRWRKVGKFDWYEGIDVKWCNTPSVWSHSARHRRSWMKGDEDGSARAKQRCRFALAHGTLVGRGTWIDHCLPYPATMN